MSNLLKNKDIENIKDIAISDLYTYVGIDVDKLSEETKDNWGLDEYSTTLTLADADYLVQQGEIEYSDIDYSYSSFEDIGYKEFIYSLVKQADHYLVYLPNSTWRGASGCGIVNSLEDAFYRDYDCHQYVRGISKGNKAVLLRESHHDVPTGHHTLIIALTEKEYNSLENADFDKMQDFALKYMYLENNKRELLKTIVNI